MNIVAIKLKKTLKVEQKISFQHAPAKALGVFFLGSKHHRLLHRGPLSGSVQL